MLFHAPLNPYAFKKAQTETPKSETPTAPSALKPQPPPTPLRAPAARGLPQRHRTDRTGARASAIGEVWGSGCRIWGFRVYGKAYRLRDLGLLVWHGWYCGKTAHRAGPRVTNNSGRRISDVAYRLSFLQKMLHNATHSMTNATHEEAAYLA